VSADNYYLIRRHPEGHWVCPHDPAGNDPDTATYCPQAVQVPVGERWKDGGG
jgi:hypothetical protein